MDRDIWNPVIASLVATIALGFQVASTLTCQFVAISAREGEILAITSDSGQRPAVFSSMGPNCGVSSFYSNVQHDTKYQTSHGFSLVSLSIGVMTFLLSWATVIFAPPLLLWRGLAAAAVLSSLMQVPVFLIFSSFPCTDFAKQQVCTLDSGGYLCIVSLITWLCEAAVVLLLDPPLWRQQLHQWSINKEHNRSLSRGEFSSSSEADEEKGNDQASHNPIFATGFERSDAMLDADRKPVLWRFVGQQMATENIRSRLSGTPAAAAAALRKSSNNGDADSVTEAPRRNEETSMSYLGWISKVAGEILTTSNKERKLEKPATSPGPESPKTGPPSLSADESVLDTITGEESILDASFNGSPQLKQVRKALSPVPSDEAVSGPKDPASSDPSNKERPQVSFTLPRDKMVVQEEKVVRATSQPKVVLGHEQNPLEVRGKSQSVVPRLRNQGAYHRLLDSLDDSFDDDEILNATLPPMTEVTISDDDTQVEKAETPSRGEKRLVPYASFDKDSLVRNLNNKEADDKNAFETENPARPPSDEDSEPDPALSAGDDSVDDRYEPTSEKDDESDNEEEKEKEKSISRNKTLHPTRIRRKRQGGSECSSSHSLLDCTIEEETEDDLQESCESLERGQSPPPQDEQSQLFDEGSEPGGIHPSNLENVDDENENDNTTTMDSLAGGGTDSVLTGPSPFEPKRYLSKALNLDSSLEHYRSQEETEPPKSQSLGFRPSPAGYWAKNDPSDVDATVQRSLPNGSRMNLQTETPESSIINSSPIERIRQARIQRLSNQNNASGTFLEEAENLKNGILRRHGNGIPTNNALSKVVSRHQAAASQEVSDDEIMNVVSAAYYLDDSEIRRPANKAFPADEDSI